VLVQSLLNLIEVIARFQGMVHRSVKLQQQAAPKLFQAAKMTKPAIQRGVRPVDSTISKLG